MRETDLAYCAGIIDGEGYVGIKRDKAYRCQDRVTRGFHARIQVRMVDEEAIAFLAGILGGTYYKEKPHANNGRPLFCWQVSDLKTEKILRQLFPYLRVKTKQARLVLILRRLQKRRARHKTRLVGYRNFPNKYGTARQIPTFAFSDQFVAWCDSLWQRCRNLNGLARFMQE